MSFAITLGGLRSFIASMMKHHRCADRLEPSRLVRCRRGLPDHRRPAAPHPLLLAVRSPAPRLERLARLLRTPRPRGGAARDAPARHARQGEGIPPARHGEPAPKTGASPKTSPISTSTPTALPTTSPPPAKSTAPPPNSREHPNFSAAGSSTSSTASRTGGKRPTSSPVSSSPTKATGTFHPYKPSRSPFSRNSPYQLKGTPSRRFSAHADGLSSSSATTGDGRGKATP